MFGTVTLELTKGLWTTFQIFILTLVFALPAGLILGIGSASRWKPLRYLIQVFVWIIRGTPLMLQLIIIFYGPGLWLGHNIWSGNEAGRITATVVAFVINYACYFSVIFRGGIEGVPAGQREFFFLWKGGVLRHDGKSLVERDRRFQQNGNLHTETGQ